MYVKWLEAAGARVVPLPFDAPAAAFERILSAVNGGLITGGETPIKDLSSAYMRAASRMYNHSLSLHSLGETWPLWGTCMGMQVLSVLGARDGRVLESNAFDSERLLLPLRLTAAAATSKLLCDTCLPTSALRTLRTRNVTVNLHHDGVAPGAFEAQPALRQAFTPLSINIDRRGRAFVSTIEAIGAPVWGVQWHPERVAFEWEAEAEDFIDHSADAVDAMAEVASFVVDVARRSSQHFAREQEEWDALVYNWKPVGRTWHQAYLFGADDVPLLRKRAGAEGHEGAMRVWA